MDPADLRRVLADPGTAVVITRLADGHVRIVGGGAAAEALAGRSAEELATMSLVHLAEGVVAVLDDGEDDRGLADLDGEPYADARSALLHLADGHRLLGAVALGQWRVRTRFCPRCGRPLTADPGHRALRCDAGHQEFPRIEPAVIVRVTDADDRILLARQPTWPPGRMSVLAGFVDPGESLEAAVHREVHEEAGITLADLAYERSQPWPFPASLMLAFTATAASTDLRLQADEIAEAGWFTRDALERALGEGRLAVPPPLSVAHQLIRAWAGPALADVLGGQALGWTARR